MTGRGKRWLIGIGGITVTVLVALSVTGYVLANRLEPLYAHAGDCLPARPVRQRRRNGLPFVCGCLDSRRSRCCSSAAAVSVARVEGDGVLLRHKGRRDLPPMFSMKEFSVEVDLGTLFDERAIVRLVTIDGMEINVPPKGERPHARLRC